MPVLLGLVTEVERGHHSALMAEKKKEVSSFSSLKHGNIIANELLSRTCGKTHFERDDGNKYLQKYFSTKYFLN